MDKEKSNELEREALAFLRQYGAYKLFLPAPVKDFLRRLADFLNWQQFKKEL